jgi:hypothetical protein
MQPGSVTLARSGGTSDEESEGLRVAPANPIIGYDQQ